MSESLLAVERATIGYGAAPVVTDLELGIAPGEVVCLFGANGAGKTTTLSAISGLVPLMGGDIRFEGRSIRGMAAAAATRLGLVQVPEDRSLFGSLTVRENLSVASHDRGTIDRALGYFPALTEILDRRAAVLSGGEQQMLALARALALNPRMLLVDEMSLGLAPLIVERILPVLRQIVTETGCSILMVEQHVHLALEIADRACVMSRGRIVREGSAAEISAQIDDLRGSYLGTDSSTPA